MRLRISNASKNSLLATGASIADTVWSRTRGLLDHQPHEFQSGDGLFFPECNSIHTHSMPFSIDVLFIDMLKRRVQRSVQNADPGNNLVCAIRREMCAVLELPVGVIRASGTEPGDVIVILGQGHCSREELHALASLLGAG